MQFALLLLALGLVRHELRVVLGLVPRSNLLNSLALSCDKDVLRHVHLITSSQRLTRLQAEAETCAALFLSEVVLGVVSGNLVNDCSHIVLLF